MKNWNLLLLTTILYTGCKKPYNPTVVNAPASYLVVEGVINSGADSTIIKLSKTVNVSGQKTANPLPGASLVIESDKNNTYPLADLNNGTYGAAGIVLSNSQKYRLRIKTPDNREYLSNFVDVENAPAIDSVSFTATGNSAKFFVSTHDDSNNLKYYRWEYQETWMFQSNYDSHYKSNGNIVVLRNLANDQIHTCWGNNVSSSINLGSTATLKKSVIVNNPVTSVPSTSEKLAIKYSILVKEYALGGDAYNFWVNLKKNTEQLGSIFDAQPSQIKGNIHSVTNPNEPVIGYISAGTIATKRIFVTNQQLQYWQTIPTYSDCVLDTALLKFAPSKNADTVNQENDYYNYNFTNGVVQYIPIEAIAGIGGVVIGHNGSTPQCVDCTLRGTNKQPVFWK